MKQYLINNNSNNLLVFFTGWGCDESEFEHLQANSDVLLLFDYTDLTIDFDFSKYKNIDLIAYSAGVFIASVIDLNLNFNKKTAISGNPYLFDEYFGLSTKIQEVLCNVTEENADDFAKNYLIKTDSEYRIFHHSKRTIESCRIEFKSLKDIYKIHRQDIKDIFNKALIGDDDPIFNIATQKEFYGKRLKMIENARHNPFFKITSYEKLLED